MIEWSDKCVRDGDRKITRSQLKKTKWNLNVPVGGCPKPVGSFGYSTDFLMRRSVKSDIDSVRKL
jgi:hypothetical protein